ncbi:MAG: hypothetical protein K5756_06785, partial [Clostridiales bacterium]|nr:hypothetical protein [Clostridiales bacterium]
MYNNQELNYCTHCFAGLDEYGICPNCGNGEKIKSYPSAMTEGTVLADRYIVGMTLGKGGFGVTYLCYDTQTSQRVAIKEYFPDTLAHRNTGETHISTHGGESDMLFADGAKKFYEE